MQPNEAALIDRSPEHGLDEQFLALLRMAGGALRLKRHQDDPLRQLCAIALWYCIAAARQGYLENLFQKHGLKWTDKQGSRLRRLIRLIYGLGSPLDDTDKQLVAIRAKALMALLAELARDPAKYAHNAANKLFAFGKERGGIAGLAASLGDDTQDEEQPEPVRNPNPNPVSDPNRNPAPPDPDDPDDPETLPDDQPIVDKFAADVGGSDQLNIDAIRANPAGLAVALISKRDGQLIVHGSSDDNEQIRWLAHEIARRKREGLFGAIVASLESQSRPAQSLPTNRREKHEWLARDHGVPSGQR